MCPPVVYRAIPWAASVAATHLLEALADGWAEAGVVDDTPLFAARKPAAG